MIEQIRGELLKKSPTFCVVDCQGIGIGVYLTVNTSQKLGAEGEEVRLLTYLHVREDLLQLFGFSDEDERALFRKLIGVSGIGPKVAITILSGIEVKELAQAISMENHQLLTKIPGVGKKTAQRIVLELKEKITSISAAEVEGGTVPAAGFGNHKAEEAVLALIALGYRQADAGTAVKKVFEREGSGLNVEQIVKFALREF